MTRSIATSTLLLDRLSTPIGELLIATDRAGLLVAVDWHDYRPRMERLLGAQRGLLPDALTPGRAPAPVRAALARYFAGELTAIDALEVAALGTPFQRAVWTALRTIPVGETTSYGALARAIGRPQAVRAVGLANGANPIGVVVPCHRVIGADRTLTGYGGGLARKRWLLAHEGVSLRDAAEPRRTRAVTEPAPCRRPPV